MKKYLEIAIDKANHAQYDFLVTGQLSIQGAGVIYPNFSGEPTRFNPQGGQRNFTLVLSEDIAHKLIDEGWNIKERVDVEDDVETHYFTTMINIRYDTVRPPKVIKLGQIGTKKYALELNENTVGRLDRILVENYDVVISPYHHNNVTPNGSSVKGYLNKLWATEAYDESDLDYKYEEYFAASNEDSQETF